MSNWLDEYAGYNDSIDDALATARFKKRHKLALFCVVVPFVFCFALMLTINEAGHPKISLALFGAFGLTILAYVHFVFRCPRCGTRPISSVPGTTGILFFPKKCSKCKAPLLPDHNWGQD